MQTEAIVAKQTSRNWYHSPALPPREIVLTIRLEIPEGTGADVGITSSFELSLPPKWEDVLIQRLTHGVHGGLASVDAPLPDEGIGVYITQLEFTPSLKSVDSSGELSRLGDTLEALAASTVTALWRGIISFGPSPNR